jgi:hypothetical protein
LLAGKPGNFPLVGHGRGILLAFDTRQGTSRWLLRFGGLLRMHSTQDSGDIALVLFLLGLVLVCDVFKDIS